MTALTDAKFLERYAVLPEADQKGLFVERGGEKMMVRSCKADTGQEIKQVVAGNLEQIRTVRLPDVGPERLAMVRELLTEEPLYHFRFPRWASTEDLDRYQEYIIAEGAQIGSFQTVSVLLWGHRSGIPNVGWCDNIQKRPRQGVSMDVWFHSIPSGTSENLSRQVGTMVMAGLLPANSIGFRPLEWEDDVITDDVRERENIPQHAWITHIRTHTKWELLENSIVNIPANPGALGVQKSLGGSTDRNYVAAMIDKGLLSSDAAALKLLDGGSIAVRQTKGSGGSTERPADSEARGNDDVVAKAGRKISAKNLQALKNVRDGIASAAESLEEVIVAAEGDDSDAKNGDRAELEEKLDRALERIDQLERSSKTQNADSAEEPEKGEKTTTNTEESKKLNGDARQNRSKTFAPEVSESIVKLIQDGGGVHADGSSG